MLCGRFDFRAEQVEQVYLNTGQLLLLLLGLFVVWKLFLDAGGAGHSQLLNFDRLWKSVSRLGR